MKIAYADPPYLGQSKRYYSDHPEHAVYDSIGGHRQLIDWLVTNFTDGWALSLSSSSLQQILALVPDDVRIAAWCKSFCAFKRGVRPAYAWEPIIYRGGRNRNAPYPEKGGKQITPKDFLVCPITMKKGLVGAKPQAVCSWILDLLNVQPGDTVVDVFPGSGAMTKEVIVRGAKIGSLIVGETDDKKMDL